MPRTWSFEPATSTDPPRSLRRSPPFRGGPPRRRSHADWNGGRKLLEHGPPTGGGSVIAAMEASGVRRLVHLGALGVEDRENLHYARSKARAERAVMESGLDWTILKPSLLLGPGDGFFNIVAVLVRISPGGGDPSPGDGRAVSSPSHVADLALYLPGSAWSSPKTVGHAFELGGPRTWTCREITAEVCRATRRRRLMVGMPVLLISLVAGAAEAAHLKFPVSHGPASPQLALDNVRPLDSMHAGVRVRSAQNGRRAPCTCAVGRRSGARRRPHDRAPSCLIGGPLLRRSLTAHRLAQHRSRHRARVGRHRRRP